MLPKSSPGYGAGVRTRTGPLPPLSPVNGTMDGIGAMTETGLTSTSARSGTDARTGMLGLFIVAGTWRTRQEVCPRFSPCCVFFEVLSPQNPGTTQPPGKPQEAVEGCHQFHSLPSPAGGCCPREAVAGFSPTSPVGLIRLGKKPSDLGGLEGSWTGAAPLDRGPVVFHCREHRASPSAPPRIPHLCPWVKARSSRSSWI